MKKKILIVTSCFHPFNNRGGAAISVTNLANVLAEKFEVYVCTTMDKTITPEKYQNVTLGENIYGNLNLYFFNRFKKNFIYLNYLIEEINPDVIYVSSLFSIAFSLPVFLNKIINPKRNIIVAPRGELMPNSLANGKIKKKIFLKVIRMTNIFNKLRYHAASENEKKQIVKVLNINPAKVQVIENISNLPKNDLSRPHKTKNNLRIVTITRITPIKNIDFFLDVLNDFDGNVDYYIYGNIDDNNYWEKCESKIALLNKNIKVHYMGYIDNFEISSVFETMHLFVSTTFSENFGHSIVEALKNGCPILISNNTPWNDINSSSYNRAIDLNYKHEFLDLIEVYYNMGNDEYQLACNEATSYINKKIDTKFIAQNYIDYFGEF